MATATTSPADPRDLARRYAAAMDCGGDAGFQLEGLAVGVREALLRELDSIAPGLADLVRRRDVQAFAEEEALDQAVESDDPAEREYADYVLFHKERQTKSARRYVASDPNPHPADVRAVRILERDTRRVRAIVAPIAPGIASSPGQRRAPSATSVRSSGSRRSSKSSAGGGGPGQGSDSDPHLGAPAAGEQREIRRCPTHGCGGTIRKPKRGPWPDGCLGCKRNKDAARKQTERDDPHARFAAMSQDERLAVLHRANQSPATVQYEFSAGEALIAALTGFIDPSELIGKPDRWYQKRERG